VAAYSRSGSPLLEEMVNGMVTILRSKKEMGGKNRDVEVGDLVLIA